MALRLLLVACCLIAMAYGKSGRGAFTAQVVENLVQKEIAKKMPAAANHKKKSTTGIHLKEATDAINKLVDESIVDRVQEAEKEVSQMLLKSIEHHIQDAGKVLLKQDENTCHDKLDSCEKLFDAGVCQSSKDAMVINCPATCNFCGVLDEMKAKEEEKKEREDREKDKQAETAKLQKQEKQEEQKVAAVKNSNKKKKLKKSKNKTHKKKHISVKGIALAPEEVRLLHENLLDQSLDHANLPMAVNTAPVEVDAAGFEVEHTNGEGRGYDDEQKEEGVSQKDEETAEKEAEAEEEKQREEEKIKQGKEKKLLLEKVRLEKEKAAREKELHDLEEKKKKQDAEKKKKKASLKKQQLQQEQKMQQQQQTQQQQQQQAQQQNQQQAQQQQQSTEVAPVPNVASVPIAGNDDNLEDPNSQVQLQQQYNDQQQQRQEKQTLAQNQQIQQQQNDLQTQPPVDSQVSAFTGFTGTEYPYSTYTSARNEENVNDLTETDVVNRDKQEEDNHAKKKSKQKLISKFVNPKVKGHKSDKKLKHEIETMVDKAFGELLL